MTPRWTGQRSTRPTGRNYRAQLGLPSVDAVQMGAWRSGTPAHTDFSAILPPNGAKANRVMARIAGQIESAGFDFAGCVTLFPRHALGLALVSFDKGLETDRAAVSALFPALLATVSAEGAAPYRSHTAFMDRVADAYSARNSAERRVVQAIKGALDPAGILSPGKQGIWPGDPHP